MDLETKSLLNACEMLQWDGQCLVLTRGKYEGQAINTLSDKAYLGWMMSNVNGAARAISAFDRSLAMKSAAAHLQNCITRENSPSKWDRSFWDGYDESDFSETGLPI